MMSHASTVIRNRLPAHQFRLVDAAANPERIYALLTQSGETLRSVYAGLPEEEMGAASLFLVPISEPHAGWIAELEGIDLHTPCLSRVWSHVDPDSLVTHLQAFLFADIGDDMSAMVRFFDPRSIEAVLGVWGSQVRSMFMAPIEQWQYRGRHADWQSIRNDSQADARVCRSIVIRLDQKEVDALMAHTEPDELLATLVKNGVVDGEHAYLDRFADFIPRYRQAVQWKISEPADRLMFCQCTYLYGEAFDRHAFVNDLLVQGTHTGEPFSKALMRVPPGVWAQIEHTRKYQLAVS